MLLTTGSTITRRWPIASPTSVGADMMTTMTMLLIAVAGIGLDPVAQTDANIFGLIAPDELSEIWTNGQRNCVIVDQARRRARRQVPSRRNGPEVVRRHRVGNRWRESPEYLDSVKQAERTYGDPS